MLGCHERVDPNIKKQTLLPVSLGSLSLHISMGSIASVSSLSMPPYVKWACKWLSSNTSVLGDMSLHL